MVNDISYDQVCYPDSNKVQKRVFLLSYLAMFGPVVLKNLINLS